MRLKNWIKRVWQDIAGTIAFEYNSIINSIRFWRAKRKADKYHKLDGKRYHVLPADNGLVVVNNDMVRALNKRLPKHKRIDIINLLKSSYYSTSVQPLTRNKTLK